MLMTPTTRKFALTVHIVCSVGLLGAIAAFLALALVGLDTDDAQTIRAAYVTMDLLARFVIAPLALAAVISGVIQSLGTFWGLFRYYWIVAKLIVSGFAAAVLLVKLELIAYAASLALEVDLPIAQLRAAGMELALHAAGGMFVLLLPTALSVYKPWGLTAYGMRKQLELKRMPLRQAALAPSQSSAGVISFTLRRSHLFVGVSAVLALHVFILHLAGSGLSIH